MQGKFYLKLINQTNFGFYFMRKLVIAIFVFDNQNPCTGYEIKVHFKIRTNLLVLLEILAAFYGQ